MATKVLSPQEFFVIPASKKAHVLALAYMATCTTEGFSKKSLFALRNYFGSKVSVSDAQVIYDFLYTIKEPTVISLYDVFDRARAWQGQLRLGQGKPVEVEEYPSLLQCLNEL